MSDMHARDEIPRNAAANNRLAYSPRTPWGAMGSVIATILVLAACQVALPAAIFFMSPGAFTVVSGCSGPPRLFDHGPSPILQSIKQFTMAILVISLSCVRNGSAREVLRLKPPVIPLSHSLCLAALAYLVMVCIHVFCATLAPNDPSGAEHVSHAASFRPAWIWLNLVNVVAGAPIAEEFMFRGFLLSALTNSRAGFAGAALLVSLTWSLAHVPWSLSGIVTNFIFGLLLVFLIWRTDSIWPGVFAHSMSNAPLALVSLIYAGG